MLQETMKLRNGNIKTMMNTFSNIENGCRIMRTNQRNIAKWIVFFMSMFFLIHFACSFTCNYIDESDVLNVCSGNGTCVGDDSCQCNLGYSGNNCEYILCFGVSSESVNDICSGHGSCIQPDVCLCESGKTGLSCNETIVVQPTVMTCFGLGTDSLNVCSGRGQCVQQDSCFCRAGFYGQRCEKDLFAGYKLISSSNLIIAENSEANVNLTASIAAPEIVLSTIYGNEPLAYVPQGQATITIIDPNDLNNFAGKLYNETEKKVIELFSLPCTHQITTPDTEMSRLIVVKHGGVYCMDEGWRIDGHTFVIVGTETVVFKLPFAVYTVATFYYLECASYRNVFWITYDGAIERTSFSGNVHGTIIGIESGFDVSDTVYGSVWYWGRSSQIMLFEAKFTDPITFDQEEPYFRDDCARTLCYGKISSDNSTCNGRGLCVANDTCLCNSDSYGDECSYYSCNGITGDGFGVCSGHGDCIATDTCVCRENYNGTWCEWTTCAGIPNTEPEVCNQRGFCLDHDSCSCDPQFGYGGSNCDIPVCNGGVGTCTGSRGVCTAPGICSCSPEFFGDYCEKSYCYGIASNDSSVCSGGHGQCVGTDTCTCHNGYIGTLCDGFTCQGFTNNDSAVCSGRGHCMDANICQCQHGFAGSNCEISTCYGISSANTSHVCSGKGVCNGIDTCVCLNNYTGIMCQETTCDDIESTNETVCNGKGTCWPKDTCNCVNGFAGIRCEIPTCFGISALNGSVCSGKGICLAFDECACNESYLGDSCQLTTCNGVVSNQSNVCIGHGKCVDFDRCECEDYYSGTFCEDFECFGVSTHSSSVCSGRGSCLAFDNCSCSPNTFGGNCELTHCNGTLNTDTKVCNGLGSCVNPDICNCNTGYFGEYCQVTTCGGVSSNSSNVCNGHGKCISHDLCICEELYDGSTCEKYQFDIFAGYKLISTNPILVKTNPSNYASLNASLLIPYMNTSTGQYPYVSNRNAVITYTSSEKGSWILSKAKLAVSSIENLPCTVSVNNPTSYFGSKKVIKHGGVYCIQSSTWTLTSSQQFTIIGSEPVIFRYNTITSTGPSFTYLECASFRNVFWYSNSNATNSSFNGTVHGTVITKNGGLSIGGDIQGAVWYISNSISSLNPTLINARFSIPTTFSPFDAFVTSSCNYTTCFNIKSTTSTVCSGNGECTDLDTCVCQSDSYGSDCSLFKCNGILSSLATACSGHGSCLAPNTCSCNLHYNSTFCDETSCNGIESTDPNVCNSRGQCKTYNKCTCNAALGYGGDDCDIFTCGGVLSTSPLVCTGHGTCSAPNTCDCLDNYTGTTCGTTTCFGISNSASNVCSGNGQCSAYDTCTCRTGYYGSNCSNFNCYGVNKDVSNVCSGHGECIDTNNCKCLDGYFGSDCSMTKCFGILSNSTLACSQKGKCVALDTCQCNSNYTGTQCQETTCNNIPSTDPTVCNGHGICWPFETCTCSASSGYTGTYCQNPSCYGYPSIHALACTSQTRGQCIAPNTCNCSENYYGTICEKTTCSGIASDNYLTCTNHGQCTAFNTCTCSWGYSGSQCELYSCNGISNLANNTCSGNGVCRGYNWCQCKTGYLGNYCDLTTCFGIQSDSSGVCSNKRGDCIAYDVCACRENYWGSNCELTTCNGIASNDSLVCNGHGKCNSFDTCTCTFDYDGQWCEKLVYDNFAGYRVVIQDPLRVSYVQNLPFESNVNSFAWSKLDTNTGYPYFTNNAAYTYAVANQTIHEKALGQLSKAYGKMGGCTTISSITSPFIIRKGGSYCVTDDLTLNSTDKIVISGTDPVLFIIQSGRLFYNYPNIIFINCASYRNLFFLMWSKTYYWSVDSSGNKYKSWTTSTSVIKGGPYGSNIPPISGTFFCLDGYCDIRGKFDGLLLRSKNIKFYDVSLTPPYSFDRYEPYITDKCLNLTNCFNIYSNNETVCSGRGRCIDYDNCTCRNISYGQDCSISRCNGTLGNNSNVCSGHGKCTDDDICTCDNHYYGEWCQYTTCGDYNNTDPEVCNGRGVCPFYNNCTCDLSYGYTGNDCEIPICYNYDATSSKVCSGHGTCYLPNSCNCSDLYFGDNCEKTYCYESESNSSMVCSGRGSCWPYNTCNCTTGFYGVSCAEYNCFGINRNSSFGCSNRGTCSNINTCECRDGYYGSNCSVSKCFNVFSNSSLTCNSLGSCIDTDNCTCVKNYTGLNCNETYCNSIRSSNSSVCSGHGECWPYNNCTCSTGYTGFWCQIGICFGVNGSSAATCSGLGTCLGYNTCNCSKNYYGANCNITTCSRILSNNTKVCSGRGSCFPYNNCTCKAGYYGLDCELDYFAGYKFVSNKPLVLVKNSASNAPLLASIAIPLQTTYTGQYKFTAKGNALLTNTTTTAAGQNLVSALGKRISELSAMPCTYTISNPTTELGRKILIKNGGVYCISNSWTVDGQTFTIIGTEPVVFKMTNLKYSSAVFNYIECASYRNVFWLPNDAVGYSNFTGTIHGTVITSSNNIDYWINAADVQGAFWFYSATNQGKTYLKDSKFGAPYTFDQSVITLDSKCNYFTCFNITSNKNNTCSGRGKCVDFDTCICNPDTYGPDCSISICNGTFGNSSNVCSGHGACISQDKCSCNYGHNGTWCQFTTCSGLPASSPLVCSQRGVCEFYNNCTCNSTLGYGGAECSIPVCNGLVGLCSGKGRGQCLSPNTCSCNAHYYGQYCQFTTCYGIESNNVSRVCNGRGVCSAYNNCTCRAGFIGDQCQIDVFAGYKLVSNQPPLLVKNSKTNAPLVASIVVASQKINPPSILYPDKVYPYTSQGNAKITSPTSVNGTLIMTELSKKVTELQNLPCDYIINKPDTDMGQKIVIEFGGVYCFKNGWTINGQQFIIVGTEPVVFKVPYLRYFGATFKFLKCASYRNVFWFPNYYGVGFTGKLYANTFSGNVHGTIVSRYGYDFMVADNIQGAVWFYTTETGYVTLKEARFSTPITFDPLVPYEQEVCNTFTCYEIEPSANNTCSGRGRCVDYNNCQCFANAYGKDCSVSMCNGVLGSSPYVCSGRGACVGLDNCICESGYFGKWCNLTTCAGIINTSPDVCSKRGVCLTHDLCTCNETAGYGGPNCDIPICGSLVGICTAANRGFCLGPNYCNCSDHYYGNFCEVTECGGLSSVNPDVCSGKGNCTSYETCACIHGFTGPSCEQYECYGVSYLNNSTCSGRGLCIDIDTCVCNETAYGVNCEISICNGTFGNESSVCSSHGACTAPDICTCREGYFGQWCELTSCFGVEQFMNTTCSSRGTCIDYNTCSCKGTYHGSNCEFAMCNSISGNSSDLVCNGVGNCIDTDICSCPASYSGTYCQDTTCFGIASASFDVCNSRGVCSKLDSCDCNSMFGYGGSNCQIPMCNNILSTTPTVCSSRGSCFGPDECRCNATYSGQFCEIPSCYNITGDDPMVCSGHGGCLDFNQCSCYSGYTGLNCTDFTCFGKWNNDSQVCSGKGFCSDIDTCICESGASEQDCSVTYCNGTLNTDPNVCNSRGSCNHWNVCNCSSHYFGTFCENSTCFGISSNDSRACSGRGHCTDFNQCSCNYGYSGNECELYACYGISSNSSNVCSGRGVCNMVDHCVCPTNYQFQTDCAVTTCAGVFSNSSNVCSSHGQCISYNNCNCSENYFGNNCEMFNCFGISANSSSVCSQKGNCSDYNICNCELNYYGNDCSQNICNGTLSSNSTVCSSRGSCVDFDLCNCTENYFGAWCELTTCYNISSDDSNVCSGKGVCVDFDRCQCQKDAYGANCSEYGCFGVMNFDSSVCSSRGMCLSTDRCNCSDNFFGNNCQLTTCFGITSNETSSCSERGNCTDFDVCQCQTGFYGLECQFHTCFATPFDNQTVCSGNGNCTHLDHCECNSNFTGIQCEILIVIPNPIINTTMNETLTNSTMNVTLLNSTLNETVYYQNETLNETIAENSTLVLNETYQNSTFNETSFMNETISVNQTNLNSTFNETSFMNETLVDNSTKLNETIVLNTTLIFNETFNETITDNITIINNEAVVNSTLETNSTLNETMNTETLVNNSTVIIDPPAPANETVEPIIETQNETIICTRQVNCSNHGECLYTGKCRCDTDDSNGFWSGEYCDSCLFGFYGDSCRFKPPVAIISKTLEVYSSCDDILIDGRSSYSLDGSDLIFHWVLNSFDPLEEVSSNHSNIGILRLKGNIPHGSYFVSLQVESTKYNQNSSIVYSNVFQKSAVPIPIVSLAVNSIDRFTNQFPLTIKKTVTESMCGYEKYNVEWSQISGPSINYQVDQYFNLYISSLVYLQKNSYTFQVTSYYVSTPSFNSTQTIIINTKSTDLSLELIQTIATETSTSLVVKFVDQESNSNDVEIWKWSCSKNNNTALLKYLNDISIRKIEEVTFESSIFGADIPNSIELTLQISKSFNRSIEKSTTIFFNIIPPIVSIVYTEPSTTFVLPGQQLFLQTLIANNQQSNLTVYLNGQIVGIYSSTGLIIDTSNLKQGSQNTITIQSYDPITGKTFTTTYTFNVATNPKPCQCSVTPSTGIALETDFDFYCANCKTDSIDYQYGFLDDKSGVKISLRKDEIFSTKIPAPYSGSTVTCYFDIIDITTNAFTTIYTNITVDSPSVASIDQLQNLVENWQSKSTQYILEGEFSKGIYQTASTSRTDAVLMRSTISYVSSRVSSLVCENGVEISGSCKCFDGFVGQYCEKSIKSFSNIQSTKIQGLRHLSLIGNNTSDSMKTEYLSLLTFAVDSILINYPYLKSDTVYESLTTFNNFLLHGLLNSKLKLSSGADVLLNSCLDSAYRYIIDKQYLTDQTVNSNNLLKSVKLSSYLQARSVPAGRAKKSISGSFFSIVLGKSFFHDYETNIHDSNSQISVEMESGFFDSSSQLSFNVLLKQFMYVMTVTDDIYSLQKRLSETEKLDSNTLKRSNLISKVVSMEYIDSPAAMKEDKLIYSIPVEYPANNESSPLGLLEERSVSLTYSCGDFLDGNSKVQSNCEMISIEGKSAKCRCNRFTNVFIIQTVTITTQSYIQYVALGASAFVILLVVSSLTLIILIICVRRKKQRIEKMVMMETAKIQDILISENREAFNFGSDNYSDTQSSGNRSEDELIIYRPMKGDSRTKHYALHKRTSEIDLLEVKRIKKHQVAPEDYFQQALDRAHELQELQENSSSRSRSNSNSPRTPTRLGENMDDVYSTRVRSGSAISVGIIWDLKEPILPEGGHSSDNESSHGSAEPLNTPKKFDDSLI